MEQTSAGPPAVGPPEELDLERGGLSRGEHPVDAYLARLTSPASRRVQASVLEAIARRLLSAEASREDRGLRYLVPWQQLTGAHTGRIRALLLEADPASGTADGAGDD